MKMLNLKIGIFWILSFIFFPCLGFAHDGDIIASEMSDTELIEYFKLGAGIPRGSSVGPGEFEWTKAEDESFESAVLRLATHLVSDESGRRLPGVTQEVLLALGKHKLASIQSIEFIRETTNQAYEDLVRLRDNTVKPKGEIVMERDFSGEMVPTHVSEIERREQLRFIKHVLEAGLNVLAVRGESDDLVLFRNIERNGDDELKDSARMAISFFLNERPKRELKTGEENNQKNGLELKFEVPPGDPGELRIDKRDSESPETNFSKWWIGMGLVAALGALSFLAYRRRILFKYTLADE
ncbi:hypothetical protein OAF27_01890 [Verrucomicrobiales bacterium]|nr:hypothetical protein [Verrucomicrobiales bacterium]